MTSALGLQVQAESDDFFGLYATVDLKPLGCRFVCVHTNRLQVIPYAKTLMRAKSAYLMARHRI